MPERTWGYWARLAVEHLASKGEPFTVDDLWRYVPYPDQGHRPNASNSQVGMVFRQAHAAGLIEQVGVTKTQAPTRRKGMVYVWRGTQP
jgi:hypothetical protein